DRQEKPEGNDDENDDADRRCRLRVLRESRQVIREHRRLIRNDDIENAVDLALKIRENTLEVLLQDVRECDEKRHERQERGVCERCRPRCALDVVKLASDFSSEQKKFDGEDASALATVRFAPVEQHSRIGQPRPDDHSRGHEAVLHSTAGDLADFVRHRTTINAMVGPTRAPATRYALPATRVGGGLHNLLSMAREQVIIPEVIEPDEKLPPDLVALRKFAYFMDEAVAIPGTSRRIGLDAAIGFIPGFGDAVGAILSAWIIIGGLRHRVPLLHVTRMVINVLLDLAIGEIPIL